MGIFGKAGAALLPMLKSGLSDVIAEAERLGIVLSTQTIAAFDNFGDRIDALGMVFDGLKNNIAAVFAENPALSAMLQAVTEEIGNLSRAVSDNKGALASYVTDGVLLVVDSWALAVRGIGAVVNFFDSIGLAALRAKAALTQAAFSVKDAASKFGNAGFPMIDAEWIQKKKAAEDAAQAVKDYATGSADRDAAMKAIEDSAERISDRVRQAAASGNVFTASLQGATTAAGALAEKVDTITTSWENAARAKSGSFSGLSGQGQFDPVDTLGFAGGAAKNIDFTRPLIETEKLTLGVKDATVDWSKSLQDVANEFNTLGGLVGGVLGKIIKSIGAVATGIAGIGTGISQMKSSGGGITGILGKVGGALGIAGAAVGIVGGIIGLFKKKKKEPVPVKPLTEQFADAVAQAERLGSVGDKNVRRLLDSIKGTAEAAAYLSKQMGDIVEGANKLGGIKVLTPEQAAAQAGLASSAFWAKFKSDGILAAGDAFKELFATMALGDFANSPAVKAITDPIKRIINASQNPAVRGALEGQQGIGQMVGGLANAGLLRQSDVNNSGTMLKASLEQAVAGGLSQSDAITALVPTLQTVASAAANMGLEVGPEVAALIAEAQAAGFQIQMPVQERIARAVESMAGVMGRGWGSAPPGPVGSPTPGGAGDGPASGGARGGVPRVPRDMQFAVGGRVPRTGHAQVHEGEYVVPKHRMKNFFDRQKELADERAANEPQKHRMANFFKRQRELKRGSSSGNSITVNLSGVAGTPEAIAHAVTQAIERGTVPRLRTAIREANQ
jgi:hypothetical protein